MLVNFSVENWMSFRDKTPLSMIASAERQHGKRVPKLAKYRTKVLPIAAIYGGNASGKTNLFEALRFARDMITGGVHPDELIPVKTFRLDSKIGETPTRFSFDLLIEGTVFEFSFAATQRTIVEERLVKIASSSEKTLYDRRGSRVDFHKSLANDQRLRFAFEGTQDNQLFLTNTVFQKIEAFKPVYDWFEYALLLIAPDTRLGPFSMISAEKDDFYAPMSKILPLLDTGITRLGGEKVPLSSIEMPEEWEAMLQKKLKEGMTFYVKEDQDNGDHIIITREDNRLIARKLVTFHAMPGGVEIKFDAQEESEGSQRIMDLLPAFLSLMAPKSQAVCVIDEIDRSLHALLIRQLVEQYLCGCSGDTRSQLLMTTHNTHLMDQKLLRRDEIWVAERDGFGASSLTCFSEYKDVRYDKDLRKSYLQGRLGGVPRILPEIPLDNLGLAQADGRTANAAPST